MKNRRFFRLYIAILVIAAGTVLNLAGSALAAAVVPRLYLDALGTVLAAALCGYIPGIFVGIITNLLKGISDPSAVYFSVLNVLIAVAAARFSKKNMFRRFPQVLLPVAVFAVIGGVIGSVFTWFLGGGVSPEGLSFARQMGRDTLYDLVDKAVSVAVASGILLLLPEKVYEWCNIGGWRDDDRSWKTPASLHSLNTRIIVMISAATILVSVIISGISIKNFHDSLIREEAGFASDVTDFAASFVNSDRVDDFLVKGEKAEGYAQTEKSLKAILDSSDSIQYMYVYRIEKDGCHVVFDIDTPELKGSEPGEVIPFDESFSERIPALLAGKPIEPLVSNDTYGWLLTAYRPIYNAKGECQCYIAVDIAMPRLIQDEGIYITQLLSLFFSFYLLILAVTITLARNFLTKPINAMASAAGEFAFNSETERGDSMERIHSMNIHTGDEIENLYHALAKTMEDTSAYISEVYKKNQAISKLQNGLIMVMADLVESRDKCTGNHIKNTAAYVKIIIEQMRREGIYVDQLTDEFAEDVVSSAPLHDIGKIKVPDAILNKPGKLTDEEFAQMRQHAECGGSIIAEAIKKFDVEDSDFLREARDLAHFHHEKWDGSGYPNHLKGLDIPLSARIMAVADVFDALVSKRSYKEGMPFEKAMSIIREGAGSHFDPLIAQAFIDAEDEVRQVSAQNNDRITVELEKDK